jgi:threonine synthase
MSQLECLFCQKKHPLDLFDPFCPDCGEPMLFFSPRRGRKFAPHKNLALEKYLDFLPLSQVDPRLSLGEGNTPLVPLSRLIQRYSLPRVLAKIETMNPTGSFKDKGTCVAVQKAYAAGVKRIGTVSTGNMAASTAAYGAKAGLKTFVFLKDDSSPEKRLATGIHGAVLFQIKADYGRLFRKSYEIGKNYNIYFMNSIDPFRIEGYKMTGYEIFFQLGGRAPRYLFVPVSSGGHLIGLIRSFQDLKQEGLIRRLPLFIGVQARGCSPLARAYEQGKNRYQKFVRAQTIAHAISNPSPPAGNLVLKLIKENNGLILAVTDREILQAQKDLAQYEGIFCDPASATTLAALLKLSPSLKVREQDELVLVITGSGLKSMETLKWHSLPVFRTPISKLARTLSPLNR